ncbi:glycoprotein 3-alpha-L-fucosyltransferase A-like [Watersipora subatra]|uniref:glycoprotein 3-alpha-L-fucosyltransferase A-like n=1 Tax=Watersipora subatra TaxID=2589382 RepID=UPI00355C0291
MVTLRRLDGYQTGLSSRVIHCGKQKCLLQCGRNTTYGADLIFFNEKDVNYYVKPPSLNEQTLKAFLTKEPQNHLYTANHESWDGFFNYSVTYSEDSEEGRYFNFPRKLVRKSLSDRRNFALNYSTRHPRALWFVSHCLHRWKHHSVQSGRVEYVQELSKHFPIDAYTQHSVCKEQLGDLIKNEANKSEPALGEYTFYLSFESTLCTDYISEKFWKVLETNGQTIPVALGGSSIEEYEKVAPPNSFIHVKNFSSPKALAKHLKYVAKNDWAFNYYHEWRNYYLLPKRIMTRSIGTPYRFVTASYRFVAAPYLFVAASYMFVAAPYRFVATSYRFVAAPYRFVAVPYRFVAAPYRF